VSLRYDSLEKERENRDSLVNVFMFLSANFKDRNLSKLASLWSTNEWKKTTSSRISLLLLSSSLISVWEKPKKSTNSCGCETFLPFLWKLQASRTSTWTKTCPSVFFFPVRIPIQLCNFNFNHVALCSLVFPFWIVLVWLTRFWFICMCCIPAMLYVLTIFFFFFFFCLSSFWRYNLIPFPY